MTVEDEPRSCLTVYHDGSCPICQREITLAKRVTAGQPIAFVDVSVISAGEVVRGLSAKDAMARFHVQRPDGTLFEGAAAFLELWRRVPSLSWLGYVARRPWLVTVLDGVYAGVLIIRPWLANFVRRIENRSGGSR